MSTKQLFGAELKKQRQAQHLSQAELSSGICSQPMLSAIEQGKYSPNSQILIALCHKLKLDSEQLVLAHSFSISQYQRFNQTCETLCNAHRYQELLTFLTQSDQLLTDNATAEQLSAYYYYLACSQFHVDPKKAERTFQLAFAETSAAKPLRTLPRLILAGLGTIAAKNQQVKSSAAYFNQAFDQLDKLPFEPNQTILFYLQALSFQLLHQTKHALTIVQQGITFATRHDSHYLLANLFYLASQLTSETTQSAQAQTKSQLLADLFDEKINQI